MTRSHATPAQIAQVAGMSEAYIKRVFWEFRTERRKFWFDQAMRWKPDTDEILIASLPIEIREAFVMRDQCELPFSPN